jgi:glycosyltransferase involved in cell wall biosynthesis
MNISLTTPINSLGYGNTGTNILHELTKVGHNVSLFLLGNKENIDVHESFHIDITRGFQNAAKYDENAPSIRIWHQYDLSQHVGKGMRVGFPIFELDTFTDQEKHQLQNQDRLFVCSKWAKTIIEKNEITTDTRVVPLGVDRGVFNEDKNVIVPNKTIFMNVGKWEVRKGHDVLIECFNKAFEPSDNVELWLCCDNPFLKSEETKKWHNMCNEGHMRNNIRIIPRQQDQHCLSKIMNKVDCGVFPSRAEGWNLELLEFMSMGKRVIATSYSAHTEFTNGHNTDLIYNVDLEPAYDGIWFNGQGNWAKLDEVYLNHLIGNMQAVHSLKQNKQLKINEDGIKTANEFTWKNTAEKIIENLID